VSAAVAHACRQIQALGLRESHALAVLLPVMASIYREVADDAEEGAAVGNVWGDTPSEALRNFAAAYRKIAAECDLPPTPPATEEPRP
jgi:hypothetical protein